MHLFYTICGITIGILALLMFCIRPIQGGRNFNATKHYLTVVFLLTSSSMFAAQFETHLPQEQFEKLNAFMLLSFFLTGHGYIYSILTLYASPYAHVRYLKRNVLPILSLFAVYTLIYLVRGDVHIYSAEAFFQLLPHSFMLMLRCVLLAATIGSILYGIHLCHKAKVEYDRMVASYFSETAFAHGNWLYNLVWSAEALSVWVLTTYFYTTPVLEIIVGVLIIIVFAFYVRAFRKYAHRHQKLLPAIVFSQEQNTQEIILQQEKQDIFDRMSEWSKRADKPYTRSHITIEEISQETGIPIRKISQHVSRQDKNFCSWINRLRIEEAACLLCESKNLTINEVAEIVGFCDHPAFSKAFKKMKNISPREYRSIHTPKSRF